MAGGVFFLGVLGPGVNFQVGEPQPELVEI